MSTLVTEATPHKRSSLHHFPRKSQWQLVGVDSHRTHHYMSDCINFAFHQEKLQGKDQEMYIKQNTAASNRTCWLVTWAAIVWDVWQQVSLSWQTILMSSKLILMTSVWKPKWFVCYNRWPNIKTTGIFESFGLCYKIYVFSLFLTLMKIMIHLWTNPQFP